MAGQGTDLVVIERAGVKYKLTLAELVALASGGGGGADPWTYVVLASDATTTLATSVNTLLTFVPAANKRYEVEGKFSVKSAAVTTGVRPGLSFPTAGVIENAFVMEVANSTTAWVARHWGNTAASNAAATGAGAANVGYLARLEGMLITGAAPVGAFTVTLASEIAASAVTIAAGSFIRYREY